MKLLLLFFLISFSLFGKNDGNFFTDIRGYSGTINSLLKKELSNSKDFTFYLKKAKIGFTKNKYYHFGVKYKNIDLDTQSIVVTIDQNNNFISLSGYFIKPNILSITPKLSAKEVFDNFSKTISKMKFHEEKKLVIMIKDGITHLAYRAYIEYFDNSKEHKLGILYLDANTGEEIFYFSKIYHALNREVHDFHNRCFEDDDDYYALPVICNQYNTCSATLLLEEGDVANHSDPDANFAYNNSGITYWFYNKMFTRDSFDNNGHDMISTVHVQYYQSGYGCHGYNASFMPPPLSQMVYGDGDPNDPNDNFVRALDVVAHELTHAVTDSESGLIYQDESGAINEALSDIFGNTTEAWSNSGGTASNNPNIIPNSNTWLVGEVLNSNLMRDMSNPTVDGYSIDHYSNLITGSEDNGGVHGNSGIMNLAFYLLSQGGEHPTQDHGIVVNGIGITKAIRIYYEAATNLFNENTSFAQARTYLAQAAETLYGDCSDEYRSVHKSYDSVGVPGSIDLRCTGGTYCEDEAECGVNSCNALHQTQVSGADAVQATCDTPKGNLTDGQTCTIDSSVPSESCRSGFCMSPTQGSAQGKCSDLCNSSNDCSSNRLCFSFRAYNNYSGEMVACISDEFFDDGIQFKGMCNQNGGCPDNSVCYSNKIRTVINSSDDFEYICYSNIPVGNKPDEASCTEHSECSGAFCYNNKCVTFCDINENCVSNRHCEEAINYTNDAKIKICVANQQTNMTPIHTIRQSGIIDTSYRTIGIITAIKDNNFWLQEENSNDYSAIYVYNAGNYSVGDKVDIIADYYEYYSLSELINSTVTVLSQNNPQPVLKNVDAQNILNLETQESQLVNFLNPPFTVIQVGNSNNHYHTTVRDNNNNEFDIRSIIYHFVTPTIGTQFDILRGILTYSYGKFTLLPRNLSDIHSQDICESVTCSEHGNCFVDNGQAKCNCDNGYNEEGLNCILSNPCDNITCSNHGICAVANDQPLCVCNSGYHPDNLECIKDNNPCDNVTCSGHGNCAISNNQTLCLCDTGYHADNLECIIDSNPCDNVTCSGHGNCNVVSGNAICTCENGYHTEGLFCVKDNNPCEGVTCSNHGECAISNNTPICACENGYHSEGLACILNNPCQGITCSNHGNCAISNNGPICLCDNGYHINGLDCIENIDPCDNVNCNEWESCNSNGNCELRDNRCNRNRDCIGEMRCNEEHRCYNINICDRITCSNHGTCRDIAGVATCECENGYHAVNLSCIKDNLCNGVTCSGHGTCSVIDNNPICECFKDYHIEGTECIANTSPCDGITCSDHGNCRVVDEKAVCECENGYHADGIKCINDNLCENITCSGHGNCKIVNNKAICSCENGYHTSELECVIDSNSCVGVTCDDHGTCEINDETTSCRCENGYHANGLNCVKDSASVCDGITCSGYGNCNDLNGVATCECQTGYTADGTNCIKSEEKYQGSSMLGCDYNGSNHNRNFYLFIILGIFFITKKSLKSKK